jgi:hypothetical protein
MEYTENIMVKFPLRLINHHVMMMCGEAEV